MPKYEVGRYEVEITGQGFQKAASSGNLQFVLQFQVSGKIDPHDPNSLLPVADGERKYYKAITENTVQWLMDDLKTLGVESLTSWAQLDPQTPGYINLAGKKVDMNCGSKNGTDGKSYEDWSIARAGTSKPIDNAASTDVKALDRLFGEHLIKKPAAAPGRTAPRGGGRELQSISREQVGSVAAVLTDDDIPF